MPSVLIEGAITMRAAWNSSMVLAPQVAIEVLSAPTRFSVPSVREVGPNSSWSSVRCCPTWKPEP